MFPESTREAGQVMQLELVTPEQLRQEEWQATHKAAPASKYPGLQGHALKVESQVRSSEESQVRHCEKRVQVRQDEAHKRQTDEPPLS
jgi:hypothetical protein